MKSDFAIALFVVLAVVIIFAVLYAIYKGYAKAEFNVYNVTTEVVPAKVVNTKYQPKFMSSPMYSNPFFYCGFGDYRCEGGRFLERQDIELYLVDLKYGNFTFSINDCCLYKSVEVGDTVEVELITKTDSKGNLVDYFMRLLS